MRHAAGGARLTRQRAQVLAVLKDTGGFRSALQIYEQLRDGGHRVGLTTVYRALQMLTGIGEIDMLRLDDSPQLFRRCGRSEHHHLICRDCGKAVEVDARTLDAWAAELASLYGYVAIRSLLEVAGVCTDCAAGTA